MSEKEGKKPEGADESIDPAALAVIDDLLRSIEVRSRAKSGYQKGSEEGGWSASGNTPDGFEAVIEKMRAYKMDERNPFWERVESGSAREILYRVIEEEFPEFHICIARGSQKKNDLVVEVAPYETDREALLDLMENSIVKTLLIRDGRGDVFETGLRLEDEGILPAMTTKRALARFYRHEIDVLRETVKEKGKEGAPLEYSQANEYEAMLRDLGLPPLADGDLRKLFAIAIRQEV